MRAVVVVVCASTDVQPEDLDGLGLGYRAIKDGDLGNIGGEWVTGFSSDSIVATLVFADQALASKAARALEGRACAGDLRSALSWCTPCLAVLLLGRARFDDRARCFLSDDQVGWLLGEGRGKQQRTRRPCHRWPRAQSRDRRWRSHQRRAVSAGHAQSRDRR